MWMLLEDDDNFCFVLTCFEWYFVLWSILCFIVIIFVLKTKKKKKKKICGGINYPCFLKFFTCPFGYSLHKAKSTLCKWHRRKMIWQKCIDLMTIITNYLVFLRPHTSIHLYHFHSLSYLFCFFLALIIIYYYTFL